jgi:precorrin-6A/cobalt-precorrin-6A reductase
MMRVLVLGGTTEASQIARALSGAGIAGVFSYAGRTASPMAQPLPTRVGGFGGVSGLADYVQREQITHVVDATHPFAAQMSGNAVSACRQTLTPLVAFERPKWEPGPGDAWRDVSDVDAAVAALPDDPARIFLAIGRQNLAPFAAKPQHFYLLRIVDAPQTPLPLPNAEAILARGPFTADADLALLEDRRITHVVAKNAGGAGARAKLDAARILGLPVIMIGRPPLPDRAVAHSVDGIMSWLGHSGLGHSDRLGV